MLQGAHIGHGIGIYRDDVGILAGFDSANIFRARPIRSAALEVAARIACAGVMPNFTM